MKWTKKNGWGEICRAHSRMVGWYLKHITGQRLFTAVKRSPVVAQFRKAMVDLYGSSGSIQGLHQHIPGRCEVGLPVQAYNLGNLEISWHSESESQCKSLVRFSILAYYHRGWNCTKPAISHLIWIWVTRSKIRGQRMKKRPRRNHRSRQWYVGVLSASFSHLSHQLARLRAEVMPSTSELSWAQQAHLIFGTFLGVFWHAAEVNCFDLSMHHILR